MLKITLNNNIDQNSKFYLNFPNIITINEKKWIWKKIYNKCWIINVPKCTFMECFIIYLLYVEL